MKLIQIRGGNASGKTETVRQFLKTHPNRLETVHCGKWDSVITVTDSGEIVLGEYKEFGCGGVDRYKSTEHVIRTIVAIAGAKTIIFEGMLYARRYKSTREILRVASSLGYEYHGILIERELGQREALLRARNGGKTINDMDFVRSSDEARRSSQRLVADGFRVDVVNVTDMPKAEMGKLIEQRL